MKPSDLPITPLPRRISKHACSHHDIEILLEDVRQSRRRRWWLTTVVVLALVAALGCLFVMAFDTGSSVGAAQRDLTYLQRGSTADRAAIKINSEELRNRERARAVSDREIQTILTKIDARLERIEEKFQGLVRRRR